MLPACRFDWIHMKTTATVLFVLAALAVPALSSAELVSFSGDGFQFVDSDGFNYGEAYSGVGVTGSGYTIDSLKSITLTGLTHTFVGDLTISFLNDTTGDFITLTSPPLTRSSNFNGTYNFVVDPSKQTIDEATTGQGDSYDIPSGTYAASDYGGAGSNGSRVDFSAFTGKSLDANWFLIVDDFGLGDTGAVQGWTATFDASPVPEPASMVALSIGAAALLRRRRK